MFAREVSYRRCVARCIDTCVNETRRANESGPSRNKIMNSSNKLQARVLIALTSHATLGADSGAPTGAYLAELAHPWDAFKKAGFEVEFASTKGGRIPLDGMDRKDPINAKMLDDEKTMNAVHSSIASKDVVASRYQAIFFAGGHGTMWDLPNDEGFQKVTARIYDGGGIVSAVCHGPAGLVNVKLSNGDYLVANKDVSAFTNDEERAVKLENVVPFMLADKLTEHGARHVAAANFQKKVVVSERLVTGQNPASAAGVAEAVVAELQKRAAL